MSKQAKRTLNPVIAKNLNLINTVLLVIVDICFMLIANGLNRYSSLSKGIFIGLNVGILVVLLLLNIAVIATIKLRKRTYRLACLCVLPVLLIVGIYGTYAVRVVNTNVDKITRTESEVVEESVEASVVTYNSSISSVAQLEGKIVGYAPNASVGILGKEKLEAEDVTVSWQEYNDSNAVMIALIGGEIDAAILPMNYMSMFANEQGISQYLDSTAAVTSYDGSVKTETTTTAGADKDLTSEPFTVLLVGTADGLSDAIMLCSVNPISMNVTITSIARDSWVPIACYAGGESKINSARASGMGCLINTVQNLTGIEIDYYVDTNFQGVVEVVDALGGILVDNPYEFVGQNASSERGHFTVYVPAGENVVLSGEQALAFARERHLYASGDFQRQANQQQVINGMLQKVLRTKNVNTALNVLKAAGDNISTNFTLDQIMEFFNYIMKKGNRYYDDAHIENVLNMQGSRYTGYNSSVWNESAQLALSIVRVYEGSIADNKKAINRNLDLNSAITAQKYIKWDATWDFLAPTISNEVYSEKIIQSETPESYYCQVTGGTWDGSSCSCPGGGEYVAQSGCKVDSATNYADGGSCVVAGFKWDETSKSCMNSCPAGTVDNNGYCQGQNNDGFEVIFLNCKGETLAKETVQMNGSAQYPLSHPDVKWDATTWNNITQDVTFRQQNCEVSHTHDYNTEVPNSDTATCDAPGTKKMQCSCGETTLVDTPKKTEGCQTHTHDYNIEVAGTDTATCDAAGTKQMQCSCGAVTTVDSPQKTEGCQTHTHDYNIEVAGTDTATCDAAGTKQMQCSCGAVTTVNSPQKTTGCDGTQQTNLDENLSIQLHSTNLFTKYLNPIAWICRIK